MIAALPNQARSTACNPLEAIKTDLLNNFFDNECGDAVSLSSPFYKHLSNNLKGPWSSASRFPWCHRIFSKIRVISFYLHFASSLIHQKKFHQRRRSWWLDHYFQCNRVIRPRKRWNRWCSWRDQSFLLQTRQGYNPGRFVRIHRDSQVWYPTNIMCYIW